MENDREIERLRFALEMTKSRLDDLVSIARERRPLDPPYDNIPLLIGTARRIGQALDGAGYHDEYFGRLDVRVEDGVGSAATA